MSLYERLQSFVGRETMPPRTARDPVNEPMIRHWCDAVGDSNPVYTDPAAAAASVHGGIVAPPTMLQAWTLPGLAGGFEGESQTVHRELFGTLDEAGFTSVVATNCEQTYERYLRAGDVVIERTVVDSVSEEKDTALGTGHFVTLRTTYTDQHDEPVGTMLFRIFKFRPKGGDRVANPQAMRAHLRGARPMPASSDDTRFFWEGCRRHELLIQRCASCGELRHPPGPACPGCGSLDWDTVRSSGRGTVYSYVVHHHPPVPGFTYPLVIALVELEEGTRLVSNLVDLDPSDVEIGLGVEVEFHEFPDDLVLPLFRPRSG